MQPYGLSQHRSCTCSTAYALQVLDMDSAPRYKVSGADTAVERSLLQGRPGASVLCRLTSSASLSSRAFCHTTGSCSRSLSTRIMTYCRQHSSC